MAIQVVHRDAGGAADALGHVVTGHLEMDAAEVRSTPLVDVERRLDFAEDRVEVARLHARREPTCVLPVHRVAHPEHGSPGGLHGLDQLRQNVADLRGSHACDQGQLARLVRRIQARP